MAVLRWGSTVTIGPANTTLSGLAGTGMSPAITALSNGGFAVAWTEGTGSSRSADFQVFNGAGIATTGKISIGADNGATYGPGIASINDSIALTWTRDTLNAGTNDDVRLQMFDFGGASTSSIFSVASTGLRESQPAIAAGHLSYAEVYNVNNDDIALSVRNFFGTMVSTQTLAIQFQQVSPTTAVLADGTIAVAWWDATQAHFNLSLFNDNATVSIVSNQFIASGTLVDYRPSIAPLANGNFVVAWADGTPRDSDAAGTHVGYQLFGPTGTKLGVERVANITATANQNRQDVVALADGGFMVTWTDTRNEIQSSYDIYGARFDVDGNRVGGEFSVVTGAERQSDPAMALLSDGRVAVTWIDTNDNTVKCQILDPRDGVVTGTALDDVLYGHPILATELTGETGNDRLFGGNSTDLLYGGAGDDTLEGGRGGDGLDGGDGNDTASYATAGKGLTASLADQSLNTGDAAGDVYTSIEGLTGSGFNDMLIGNGGPNTLTGGAGDDTIAGGAGTDTAVFSSAIAQTRIGLRDATVIVSGADGVDTLSGIELFKFGAAAALTLSPLLSGGVVEELMLKAIGGVNTYVLPDLYGGPVAGLHFQLLGSGAGETVLGTSKSDFINAGAGDDAVDGGAGNDVIDGGTGSNFLTGGAGVDTFFVDGRGGTPTWSTITDWQVGEQLSVFGWKPGISKLLWLPSDGTPGFTGVTLHTDLDGDGLIDTSVTWTGKTQADLPTPLEFADLLWFV